MGRTSATRSALPGSACVLRRTTRTNCRVELSTQATSYQPLQLCNGTAVVARRANATSGTSGVLLSREAAHVVGIARLPRGPITRADRIAVLHDGEIAAIVPRADATAEQLGLLMAGAGNADHLSN